MILCILFLFKPFELIDELANDQCLLDTVQFEHLLVMKIVYDH